MTVDKLDKELEAILDVIEKLDPASEEYTTAVNNYEKLNNAKVKSYQSETERYKIDVEYTLGKEKLEAEVEENAHKRDEAKKDRRSEIAKFVGMGVFVGGIEIIGICAEEIAQKILKSKAPAIASKAFTALKVLI